MKNILLISFLLIVLFLVVLLSPIEIELKISSTGKILPVREVDIIRSQDDRIVMISRDNLSGVVTFYQTLSFGRGDAIKLAFRRPFKVGDKIMAGDTIAKIISADIEYQLVRLKGLVQTEMATLNVLKTGAKEEVIKEMENRLAYAKQQLDAQQRIFERMKILYEKNLISQQEYEVVESTLELYRINFNVVKSQLEAFKTGAKKEEIEASEVKIKALEDEINALLNKLNSFCFLSPVNGIVFKFSSSDTIISIADESEYVVISLFESRQIFDLKEGQDVEVISTFGISKGKIYGMDNCAYFVNGREVVPVRIKIDKGFKLLPNSFVKCNVYVGKLKIKDYVYRILTEFLRIRL